MNVAGRQPLLLHVGDYDLETYLESIGEKKKKVD
jgi:hypothetical protein